MTEAVLRIDFGKCVKAGECYYNHPDLFAQTESGYPALKLRAATTARELHEAREAAEVCPARAISVAASKDH